MATRRLSFGFPFTVDPGGRVEASGGDEMLRGKILQVLFTAPGERLHRPDFGCGLFNLVFEPNDAVLAAATEFTVNQALLRWLSEEIVVDGVAIRHEGESVIVEIAYTRRADRQSQAVRVRFR
ncbi:GPW/gp25 family protein [Halomonas ramblicola]|uniref:GPW/gp25 family protein n=1 Tax=Halomonas ramblicola TaxID=747349 RepID=UPI0025B41487|nr:GPW/gp25 family protein [Halomonas ramblicola]MDN3522555.1 GPW/gp25 family protein [Halomonas ramblicola]